MSEVKPFLKWVGGKSQIMETLYLSFPMRINNYHEIFLGGGSVLFELLNKIKFGEIEVYGTINAYDINKPLIYTYINIQNKYLEIDVFLFMYLREYNQIEDVSVNRNAETKEESLTSKESYYYFMRKRYNSFLKSKNFELPECSAIFIFLNKTCFRGLYRMGPNGFNVPYGNYKSVKIDSLKEVSIALKDVQFKCLPFEKSINEILNSFKSKDFVYLDPPYALETKKSFVGYSEYGFPESTHLILFKLIKEIDSNGIDFVMSNSDVKLVKDNFQNFYCKTLTARRAINSKNPESITNEVIISN